ncbi:MAG: polysaccharide deacetylase family protein [Bacteriovoracaceae bacterium]|nr:polysaccharide deacetylase family protein [Bacteriovoracaceae bacterium]
MKKLLFAIFLISFVSVSADNEHVFDEYFESMSGGLSGGNSEIFDLDTIISKDLKPRNIQNLNKGKKEITITIDDGPTRGVTDKILDVLKKHNIQATFFILGSKVSRSKSILERMVREGHIVANHSMEHKNIGEISGIFKAKKIKEAIIDAHKLIEPYMTNSSKWYFRAPYGSWQSRAASIINSTDYGSNYYGPVLWDIGGDLDASLFKVNRAADWGCWSKGWSVNKCLKGYINETDEKKGGVVLFHDLKSESVELIERYIEEYSKRPGYKFVSLDDVKID